MQSQGADGIDEEGFPGTMLEDIKKLACPTAYT